MEDCYIKYNQLNDKFSFAYSIMIATYITINK